MPGELRPPAIQTQAPVMESAETLIAAGLDKFTNQDELDSAKKGVDKIQSLALEGRGWLVSLKNDGGINTDFRNQRDEKEWQERARDSFLDKVLENDAIIAASEWNADSEGQLSSPNQLLGIEPEDIDSEDMIQLLADKLKIPSQKDFQKQADSDFPHENRYFDSAEYQALSKLRESRAFKNEDGTLIGDADAFVVSVIGTEHIDRIVYVNSVVKSCAEKLADKNTPPQVKLQANLALQLALSEQTALVSVLGAVKDAVSSRNIPYTNFRLLNRLLDLSIGRVPKVEGIADMPDREKVNSMKRDFRNAKDYGNKTGEAVQFVFGSPQSLDDSRHARHTNIIIRGSHLASSFLLRKR